MQQQLIGSILRTGNSLRRYVDRQAEQAGIECGGPHMRILGYLAHHPERELCQKDIEASFGLARSTVSAMLGQLEGQALIRREPVAEDARLKRVVLTDKALDLHHWIEAQSQRLEAAVCRDFTPEEHAQFLSYLARVMQNLGCPGDHCACDSAGGKENPDD